jgi:hypothetical protein
MYGKPLFFTVSRLNRMSGNVAQERNRFLKTLLRTQFGENAEVCRAAVLWNAEFD